MKKTEKFSARFAEYDQSLMEARVKKEKNILKKELRKLEDERDTMREHLYRVETLIEKLDDRQSERHEQITKAYTRVDFDLWPHLEAKLKSWENRLARIFSKESKHHSEEEYSYAEKTLPSIKAEKNSILIRLRSIEDILAKAKILADDLNEDLCRNFSAGRSLAEVGGIVLQEFGHKLKESHSKGRTILRNFLEQYLKITKVSSRELFSLLEETGVIVYRVDIDNNCKDLPLMCYPYEDEYDIGIEPVILSQINGWWEIKV